MDWFSTNEIRMQQCVHKEEEEEEEEIIRLPWRGQCGRAAAARALCACCAAGYAKDCTGSPVRF
jgi:hypothetical protein